MALSERKSRNIFNEFYQNKNYTLYTTHYADTERTESFRNKMIKSTNKLKNIKQYFTIISNPNNSNKFPILTEGNILNGKKKIKKILKSKKIIKEKNESFLTRLKKIDVNFHTEKKLKEEEKNESYDRIYNKIKLFRTKTHLIDNRLNLLGSENIYQYHKDILKRKYATLNEDAMNKDKKEIDESQNKVKFLKNTMDYIYPKYVLAKSKLNNLQTSSFRNKKYFSPSQQKLQNIINEKMQLNSYLTKSLKINNMNINSNIQKSTLK